MVLEQIANLSGVKALRVRVPPTPPLFLYRGVTGKDYRAHLD
jgi:hypothetical protein